MSAQLRPGSTWPEASIHACEAWQTGEARLQARVSSGPRTGNLCEKPDFASVPSSTCMNGSHSNTCSWAHRWSQGSSKGVQRGPNWTPLLEAWLHWCAKQHVFEWEPLGRWSQDSVEWAWADLRGDGFLGYVWQDTSAKAQPLDVTGRDASRLVC